MIEFIVEWIVTVWVVVARASLLLDRFVDGRLDGMGHFPIIVRLALLPIFLIFSMFGLELTKLRFELLLCLLSTVITVDGYDIITLPRFEFGCICFINIHIKIG